MCGAGVVRTLAVGRSTRTAVTSLPGFTSRVPGFAGSIDAGLWLSANEPKGFSRKCYCESGERGCAQRRV